MAVRMTTELLTDAVEQWNVQNHDTTKYAARKHLPAERFIPAEAVNQHTPQIKHTSTPDHPPILATSQVMGYI